MSQAPSGSAMASVAVRAVALPVVVRAVALSALSAVRLPAAVRAVALPAVRLTGA